MSLLRNKLEEIVQGSKKKPLGEVHWLDDKVADFVNVTDELQVKGRSDAVQNNRRTMGYQNNHYDTFSRWIQQLFRRVEKDGVTEAMQQSPGIIGAFKATAEEGVYQVLCYKLGETTIVPYIREEAAHFSVPLMTTERIMKL